jgi:hypothetical protein
LEADFLPLVGLLIAGFFAGPVSSALGSGLGVLAGVSTAGSKCDASEGGYTACSDGLLNSWLRFRFSVDRRTGFDVDSAMSGLHSALC